MDGEKIVVATIHKKLAKKKAPRIFEPYEVSVSPPSWGLHLSTAQITETESCVQESEQ